MQLNHPVVKALQYLLNTGESVTAAQFDDDHDPIGTDLRVSMELSALIWTDDDGVLKLTDLGRGINVLAERQRLKERV